MRVMNIYLYGMISDIELCPNFMTSGVEVLVSDKSVYKHTANYDSGTTFLAHWLSVNTLNYNLSKLLVSHKPNRIYIHYSDEKFFNSFSTKASSSSNVTKYKNELKRILSNAGISFEFIFLTKANNIARVNCRKVSNIVLNNPIGTRVMYSGEVVTIVGILKGRPILILKGNTLKYSYNQFREENDHKVLAFKFEPGGKYVTTKPEYISKLEV